MYAISAIVDEANNKTYISISYDSSVSDDYVILEYYDEVQKKWIPYDNKNGIIELFK